MPLPVATGRRDEGNVAAGGSVMLPAGLTPGPDFAADFPPEVIIGVFIALIALGVLFLRRI